MKQVNSSGRHTVYNKRANQVSLWAQTVCTADACWIEYLTFHFDCTGHLCYEAHSMLVHCNTHNSQPVMWKQCSVSSHADGGQELELMFTSTVRVETNVMPVTLTVTWSLVTHVLVWVFLRLLVSWAFHTAASSRVFTQRGVNNKKKHGVSSNTLLMRGGVRG